ncbi:MAG: hypothetical protein H6668_22815 [Ardenticatenaceae bacterium]|nr:hypothetical protein [Ardenticatenaceae bacterium]
MHVVASGVVVYAAQHPAKNCVFNRPPPPCCCSALNAPTKRPVGYSLASSGGHAAANHFGQHCGHAHPLAVVY